MSEGFYFANWRIWQAPETHDIYLQYGEQEIVFRPIDLDGLIEMIARMSNADYPEHRRVHSTNEVYHEKEC